MLASKSSTLSDSECNSYAMWAESNSITVQKFGGHFVTQFATCTITWSVICLRTLFVETLEPLASTGTIGDSTVLLFQSFSRYSHWVISFQSIITVFLEMRKLVQLRSLWNKAKRRLCGHHSTARWFMTLTCRFSCLQRAQLMVCLSSMGW